MLREISTKKIIQIIASKKTFLICLLFGLFLYPDSALAAATYNSLVQIPLMPPNPNALDYLSGLNNFLISVVGLVAMGAIVIGGARYLTSAGNPSAIEDAKHTIYQAIWGLILALTSWVIISTINPDILVLKKPGIVESTSVYGYGSKTPQCALPGGPIGPGTPVACRCIDDPQKDVFAANPFPPYVVATVPAPCAGSIPTAAPAGAVVITYSEKMDKASVENPLAVTIVPSVAFNNANTTRILDATGMILTITPDPALALVPNTGHLVTVVGGNPAYNKNVAGTPLASSYTFRFQTTGAIGACAPPITPFGSFCNKVCGNKDLALDGTYHCLKTEVRIGWVAADPSTYTIDQLRALAVNTGTDSSPFIAYDQARYIFEVEKYTQSLYPIVEYKADKGYDNICDDLLTDPGWNRSTAAYGIAPPGSTCKNSTTPKALVCSQLFCVRDSQGNEASTLIYYNILAP